MIRQFDICHLWYYYDYERQSPIYFDMKIIRQIIAINTPLFGYVDDWVQYLFGLTEKMGKCLFQKKKKKKKIQHFTQFPKLIREIPLF